MTHHISKWVAAVLPVLAVTLAGGLYLLLYGKGEGREIFNETIEDEAETFASGESGDRLVSPGPDRDQALPQASEDPSLCVHVCGQVGEEGIYFLTKGARIADAVEAAGGFTEDAATDYLNLALPLSDGMKIYVPKREEVVSAFLFTGDPQETGGTVNINTADESKLMTLPGIGERKAEDIIAFREKNGAFERPEDIMYVPGIKDALYEKIRENICVR